MQSLMRVTRDGGGEMMCFLSKIVCQIVRRDDDRQSRVRSSAGNITQQQISPWYAAMSHHYYPEHTMNS